MNIARYILAVAIVASVSACREDASVEQSSVISASSGGDSGGAVPTDEMPVEASTTVPDSPATEPLPPNGEEPPVEEAPPEPKLDIDGLPLPDLSVSYDYEAYLAAQPLYYTRVSSPFGNVESQNNTPFRNRVNNASANLGRIIFYDVRLSANNSIACASCHIQQHGFTDPKPFSDGFDGGKTGRHSMGLSNAAYYKNGKFFWDERADSLEEQVLMPIQDSVEMGMNLFDLEVKLGLTSFYAPLFERAFGDEAITSERISLAMAQFIRSMVSYQSTYDQAFVAGEWDNPDFAAVFTEQELLGHKLFSGIPGRDRDALGCASCHQSAAHTMDQAHVNGLDGRGAADQGAQGGFFKAPSLRNIGVGAPYMHDGRLSTLMDVVEFYNSGIQRHPNLSPDLTTSGRAGGTPVRMNMSQEEKEALVAFLETLTDDAFLSNPIFSDPYAPPLPE